MKVTVKFFAYLRDQIGGTGKVELILEDDAMVSHLLIELCNDSKIKTALLDADQKLKPELSILKNGREIKFLDGMESVLCDGDEISIFPMVAGGNIIV